MHIFFYPNRQFNECSEVFFRLRKPCWQAQPHEPVILLAMKTARLVLHKRFNEYARHYEFQYKD